MGRHPMGEGVDPNPRFVAEKLVDPGALIMGTDRREPARPLPAADQGARRRASPSPARQKLATAYADGQDPARPRAGRDPQRRAAAGGWPPTTSRRAPARRWRTSPPSRPRSARTAASPPATPPASTTARRRACSPPRRSPTSSASPPRCGWSPSPSPASSPRSWASARSRPPRRRSRRAGLTIERHRPVRAQRGVRRPGARLPRPLRHRRRRPAGQPVGRRDRRRPPARLLRRPPDDPARPRSSRSTPRSATA